MIIKKMFKKITLNLILPLIIYSKAISSEPAFNIWLDKFVLKENKMNFYLVKLTKLFY